MNKKRLWGDFRKNLLRNAQVGWGRDLDAVVKQATGSPAEVKFLSELFGSPPETILFIFREPQRWYESRRKKFPSATDPHEVTAYYEGAFKRHSDIGGIPIVYDETLPDRLGRIKMFSKVDFSDFQPTVVEEVPQARHLDEVFQRMCAELLDP